MIPSMFRKAMVGDGSTLWADFTTGVLDSRFTFTRASTTATYINASGNVATAGTNVPRFDYDPITLSPRGLLIEGTATNLSRSSQNLTDAAYWTLQTAYASTSATGGIAPDGTNTGSLFTEPSSNLQRSIYQSYSSAAGTYTFSLWLKAGSGSTRYMRLVVSSGAGDFGYVTINMSTGAIQQAATVVGTATNAAATVSGNYTATGWRRYSLTVTLAASVNFVFLVPIDLASIDTPTTNYGRIAYLGNGSSFLIWGAQLEAGSGASSYIPTGASTVQRLADECQLLDLTTMGFNASAGTIYVDMGARISTGSNRSYTFLPASGGNNQIFEGSGIALNVYSSGSFVAQIGTSTAAAQKIASAYEINDYAVSVNGGAVATDTSGALPTSLTKLTLGGSIINTAAYQFGCIRTFKYWPTRLPNATLQSLTT